MRKTTRFAGSGLALGALTAMTSACLDRPIEPVDARTTSVIVEKLAQSKVDKIDLLLSIDNSQSMADKQLILADAVPNLVEGLLNPPCVDADGVVGERPASPTDKCPTGQDREFDPVLNVHVGIISSSLGDFGAGNNCGKNGSSDNPNDHAQLLSREQAPDTKPETYQNLGFLAWDPAQKLSPAGEADFENDSAADGNNTALNPTLAAMVRGVSENGCGYEAQHESWYRFLVEPRPPRALTNAPGEQVQFSEEDDDVLLKQRKDFLRPDSLLAIIMLTDENDCSIQEYDRYYLVADGARQMSKARSECETDPNDPCCKSCKLQKQGECPDDPTCAAGQEYYPKLDDHPNLRCWDQKRRFGIDFLHEMERYQRGLTQVEIKCQDSIRGCPKEGVEDGRLASYPNPILSNLSDDPNANVRGPELVFFAALVGVPWQDIARDPSDLTKGFKTFEELSAPAKSAAGGDIVTESGSPANTWDIILGEPSTGVKPLDPLMRESVEPRTGENPIGGFAIQTISDAGQKADALAANPYHGGDRPIPNRDDLQYACTFPLKAADNPCEGGACDCDSSGGPDTNPLCTSVGVQTRAKAYPGIRHLQLTRALGTQGVVASVCPATLENPTAADYGYRPAIGAIVDRLKQALTGACLPRTLNTNDEGQVPCLVIEAKKGGADCNCDVAGRRPVDEANAGAIDQAQEQGNTAECFCEIVQLEGDDREKCRTEESSNVGASGWCYIDASVNPPIGNPELVADCPVGQERQVRIVGIEQEAGSVTYISCSGDTN